jgi:glutathione S-transferase
MQRPIVHHIPVCPFSQRLEILLALKGDPDAVEFRTVDITRPRDPALVRLTGGAVPLPVMELPGGRVLRESLVLLGYLDETATGPAIRRADPYEHAVERMLIAREGSLVDAGYSMVMNQSREARKDHADRVLACFAGIDAFLRRHATDDTFLFDGFGLAEAVFTPIFVRFWFLDYYEGFDLPEGDDFSRVCRWRDACLAHRAAQQVSREEVVKSYYDYALGAGNGALVPGRSRSSFVFTPHWRDRPWPPSDKYAGTVTDRELGLV